MALAVLGYVSLRQWRLSSELLFAEQSRSMAAMVAEKLDLALRHADYEALGRLEATLGAEGIDVRALDALARETPALGRLTLLDREGRQLHPPLSAEVPVPLAGLPADEVRALWERGGPRHLVVGEDVVVLSLVRSPRRPPVLAALFRNPEQLRQDLERTLGGIEGPTLFAVTDHRDRPVYRRTGRDGVEAVAAVPVGEALPSWRVLLYQPETLSPRTALRRQGLLFTVAFGLLLVVIAAGLWATYRLVRRETDMARLKADFVANVSHDLKTPISLIRVFAETLEMGRAPDEASRQEYYHIITRESERLSRLIDNVLDFSRIEGGRRRYDVAPTAVEPLVRETLDAFGHVLAQEKFRLEVAIEPELPAVPMDAEAVSQALANLVDNAVKYSTDRRALRVEAALVDGGLALIVADQGIGIPREEQSRIFEKFYRVGCSETQGRRGSGVGLALVRHVVEAHGGRVTLDSRPGEGSRFTLCLPLAGAAASPAGMAARRAVAR